MDRQADRQKGPEAMINTLFVLNKRACVRFGFVALLQKYCFVVNIIMKNCIKIV